MINSRGKIEGFNDEIQPIDENKELEKDF